MIIKCIHGYFIVREQSEGEVARFNSIYETELVTEHDYFTFSQLVGAPEHSILGQSYLGLIATATYAGKPWEVMEENGYVYDFTLDVVRPIASITSLISPVRRLDGYWAKGLIQPGSINNISGRVTGYTCHFDPKDSLTQYRYSEITYA